MVQRTRSEYHWRNGWYLSRLGDGSVRIYDELNGGYAEIPTDEWAGVVRDGELTP